MSDLIKFKKGGFYCEKGNFYIDPKMPVDYAVITHAHSDHSYFGHKQYLATNLSVPIIKARLGQDINIKGEDYGKVLDINGVKVSFHRSGHIVGSAQVRVEYEGEVWVVTGDYKLNDDGVSGKFEIVECDNFVTESTFGLPIFNWEPQEKVFEKINSWWNKNKEAKKNSVLLCYSLGKAQRILNNVDHSIGEVVVHGAIYNMNEAIKSAGIELLDYKKADEIEDIKNKTGMLILATSSVLNTPWLKKFYPYEIANASGWMALRGIKRRESLSSGFVLSDHADWKELNLAIKNSKAKNIYVTHGYEDQLVRYLNENGYNAKEVHLW